MTELTMLIEVRTDSNIQGSEQFSEKVKTIVQATLDRFSDRIRRVDVHLSDATGNKAGHEDKCCKIEARRDGRDPIVVTHHETDMDQAIRGAVHSLKKSVESAFGKESTSDHLRDHH
jgi:ribosome-associated translation inhibitor RaiA